MTIKNSTAETAIDMEISDLEIEARNFLDGGKIETQAQADAIGLIVSKIRQLRKSADALRAAEKRPHDEAAKAVQAKFKPMIDRADRVIAVANPPLTDWLARQEAARHEAERLARAALVAAESALIEEPAPGSLEEREQREDAIRAAKRAHYDLRQIENDRPQVAGVGRAIGLRTHNQTIIQDGTATIRWLIANRPDELKEAVLAIVNREPLSTRRTIPGILVQAVERAA